MNYGELLNLAEKCTVTITAEEARLAEEQMRGQATSRLWFRMRTGRITAYRFKTACHTNIDSHHSASSCMFSIQRWPSLEVLQHVGDVSMSP